MRRLTRLVLAHLSLSGLHGEGGGAGDEKLEKMRKKETKHKQGGFEGKGKQEAMEKGKHAMDWASASMTA